MPISIYFILDFPDKITHLRKVVYWHWLILEVQGNINMILKNLVRLWNMSMNGFIAKRHPDLDRAQTKKWCYCPP